MNQQLLTLLIGITLGLLIVLSSPVSGCNGANSQSPEMDIRTIRVGQPCPAAAMQVLIDRNSTSPGLVENWQVSSQGRFYRVTVRDSIVESVQSQKIEWFTYSWNL